MGHHHIFLPDLPLSPDKPIIVRGEEAHHALRVRRLTVGAQVLLGDGRGTVAQAVIRQTRKVPHTGEWELELATTDIRRVEPPRPAIHVFASAPKGDHLAEMIDGLSQVGAASWRPLLTQHTIVDPREAKMDRMRRIAIESLKQCGRAHLLEIAPPADFAAALRGPCIVLGDASGPPWSPIDAAEIDLLIGPEGGWNPQELAQAKAAGAITATFGRHIMRTETAAVVAAAMIAAPR